MTCKSFRIKYALLVGLARFVKLIFIQFMAKGKSQYCTWYCKDCNRANYITYYDKRRNDEIVKELKKFCPQCRKHVEHKRKDTKKAAK